MRFDCFNWWFVSLRSTLRTFTLHCKHLQCEDSSYQSFKNRQFVVFSKTCLSHLHPKLLRRFSPSGSNPKKKGETSSQQSSRLTNDLWCHPPRWTWKKKMLCVFFPPRMVKQNCPLLGSGSSPQVPSQTLGPPKRVSFLTFTRVSRTSNQSLKLVLNDMKDVKCVRQSGMSVFKTTGDVRLTSQGGVKIRKIPKGRPTATNPHPVKAVKNSYL